MEQTINIVPDKKGELIIRQGQAAPIALPERIKFNGVISTVSTWLSTRIETIDQKKCCVVVNKDDLLIQLLVNEKDAFSDLYQGKLEFSKELEQLGINCEKTWDSYSLAKFFRMNRTIFENVDKAIEMAATFKKFEAKIEQQIEKIKDNRANYSSKKAQTVATNIPESIKLTIPIFKGMDPETITVEFDIEPNNLGISLVSPQAADITKLVTDECIDKEVEDIEEIAPGIVILFK